MHPINTFEGSLCGGSKVRGVEKAGKGSVLEIRSGSFNAAMCELTKSPV